MYVIVTLAGNEKCAIMTIRRGEFGDGIYEKKRLEGKERRLGGR